MTITVICTCESPYQDKLYGKGKRVANCGVKDAKCTVCGKTHAIKDSQRETKGSNQKKTK